MEAAGHRRGNVRAADVRTRDPEAGVLPGRKPLRRRSPIQQELPNRSWGGRRAHAGRKKDDRRNLLDHRPRPEVTERSPAHVTLRVRPHVWNLRTKRAFRVVTRALRAAHRAHGDGRFVHFSVQGNHLHLVVEADDTRTLARRVQGLEVRLARALNRMMDRSGPVFADRYHVRVLHSPREVRGALEYILRNAAKHHGLRGIDPFSSGPWFDGWLPQRPVARGVVLDRHTREGPVAPPRSWVLRVGWRRGGLLDVP